jgi:uncharacterized protein YegJ (DUF2314 family)
MNCRDSHDVMLMMSDVLCTACDEGPVEQEMKQKTEYAFGLSMQVTNKAREAQQYEKEARDSKADTMRLARELEDCQAQNKVWAFVTYLDSPHKSNM